MNTPKPFKKARLNTCNNKLSDRWFIYFYCTNPKTAKLQRVKLYEGFKEHKTVDDRIAYGKAFVRKINRKLTIGWNYFEEKSDEYINADFKIISLKDKKTELASGFTIEQAFSIVFNTHIKRLRPRTIGSYKSHTRVFFKWLEQEKLVNKDVSFINNEIVSKFISKLTDQGLHNTTRNHYLGTLRTICNHLVNDKILSINPFNGIKKLKTIKQGSLYFKKHHIELLKKDISENNSHLWFYIQFMYYGFLRPSEIRKLKVGDIDFGNEKIRVPGDISKNNKSQFIIIIPDWLESIMENEIHLYPDHFYIFGKNGVPAEKSVSVNHFYNLHKPFLQKYKLYGNGYTPYSWKHTGICMAALNNMPLTFIQQQARHYSLQQLTSYLHSMGITDMEGLKSNFPKL